MAFDPAEFEATVALRFIPTERLPAVAQDAMEAGFDGPHVLRMAILDPVAGWEVDQALPFMLAELGCGSIRVEEAALRLACLRARHILDTGEDLRPSVPYFHDLMEASGWIDELVEVGYFDDEAHLYRSPEEEKLYGHEVLERLLSPDHGRQQIEDRKAEHKRQWAARKSDWPYVFDSPTGRKLFKERCREKLLETRPILLLQPLMVPLIWWAYGSWRAAIFLYAVVLPVQFALLLWGQYRRMKWERRDLLLRARVPEDQI